MKPVRTLIAAAIAVFSLNASAVTLPTDGSWLEFDFDDNGSAIYDSVTFLDSFAIDTSFSFTLSQNSVLRVVDLGFAGDQFNILANGNSLGLTSTPIAAGEEQQFDTLAAWDDERWSKGSWNLAAGNYTITGLATLSPSAGGFGAMSVTAVPEPESWALLLAGLGMLGTIARRRYGRHV